LFKCGSAAGWSGPAIFLLKGKKAPVGLDQAYLEMCLVGLGLTTTGHLATPSPQGTCPQGGHPGRRRGGALTTTSSPESTNSRAQMAHRMALA
jgi:hypothetical protein